MEPFDLYQLKKKWYSAGSRMTLDELVFLKDLIQIQIDQKMKSITAQLDDELIEQAYGPGEGAEE